MLPQLTGKVFDPSYAKTAVAFCEDDNRALGRIECMARASGKDMVKWVSEVRRDDARVQQMLKNYWISVGGKSKWTGKTPTGTKWSIANYRECVTVTTEVEKETPGKMMWKEEYLEHAKTAAAGLMTREKALRNWAEWEAKYNADESDPSINWDLDGPESAPLRFRVALGKFGAVP